MQVFYRRFFSTYSFTDSEWKTSIGDPMRHCRTGQYACDWVCMYTFLCVLTQQTRTLLCIVTRIWNLMWFFLWCLQDDFAHLRPLCYPQADVAIICFSVVDQASFESAKTKWVKELERYCPGVPVVVIGTQTDMRENPIVLKELKAQGIRPITKSEGNKFAAHISAAYVECSALTQQNIKCAFDEAIATALELNTSSRKRTPHCHKPCTIL